MQSIEYLGVFETGKVTNNWNIFVSVKDYFSEEALTSYLRFSLGVEIIGAYWIIL